MNNVVYLVLKIWIISVLYMQKRQFLYECDQSLKKTMYVLELPSISRIKNSIKLNRVQHILRHIYYATMQKLCKFEALYMPEIQCKSHKGNP